MTSGFNINATNATSSQLAASLYRADSFSEKPFSLSRERNLTLGTIVDKELNRAVKIE